MNRYIRIGNTRINLDKVCGYKPDKNRLYTVYTGMMDYSICIITEGGEVDVFFRDETDRNNTMERLDKLLELKGDL